MLKSTFRFMLPLFLLMLVANHTLLAQTITVSTTTDEVNGNTANVAALIGSPGGGGISLREAVIATNNEPVGSTVIINIPSGNYALTIAGVDNTAAAGDLDVNTTVAVGNKIVQMVGAGSAVTTITGLAGERILDVHAINNNGNITFTLSGVKLTGGSPSTGSGGAMLTGRPGDATILNNCLFIGNTSSNNGGAISQSSGSASHDLNVTNCTFTSNTATGAVGGAINYAGVGNVTITGCTFTNNSAGTQGGAINISGSGTGTALCNIIKNNFTNNTANGSTYGGAVVGMVNVQTININYNRLVGNSSANVSTGKLITTGGGTVGAMDLTNNWWGVNGGPNGSTDILGTIPATWLQLKASASPTQTCVGGTALITASFLSNNLSNAISSSNLSALTGVAVSFVNPVLGALTNAQTTIQSGSTATVTYTAGNTQGAGSVNAIVDNVPSNDAAATASVTVTTGPTVGIIVSPSATVCDGAMVTLSGTGASTYTWDNGVTDGVPFIASIPKTISNTNGVLMVGLRKLVNSYAGPCLQLRRSSDNAVSDFGFNGIDLDVAAITAWLGNVKGYCSKLYDQSGSGNDVTQTSNSLQPQYVASGIYDKPILHFTVGQKMINTTNFGSPFTVVYSARQTGPNRHRVLSSIGNNWLLGWWNGYKSQAYFQGWVSNPISTPDNKPYVYSGVSNGITSQFYENGNQLANNSGGVTGPNGISLGGGFNGSSEYSDCDFMDVMIYNSALSDAK